MIDATENIFGKQRKRFDEAAARAACDALVRETLNHIWALSDADLMRLIQSHDQRNKTGTHRLSMTMAVRP